jgi:beta-lactamase class A
MLCASSLRRSCSTLLGASLRVALRLSCVALLLPCAVSAQEAGEPLTDAQTAQMGAQGNLAPAPLPQLLPARPSSVLNRSDRDLQSRLEREVQHRALWLSLTRRRNMAIGLVDLSRPGNPRAAFINPDQMIYAASLPKIAVLLTAMRAIDQGTIEPSADIDTDMQLMIRFSNNEATTRMIDRVGLDAIAETVQDSALKLYDEDHGGGLWVGKRYVSTGPRNGDPIQGLSHAATARQVSRFYYMLATGQLLSPQRSREMLQILRSPGLHHKFVNELEKTYAPEQLFRKSGTWQKWHADSILAWGGPGEKRFILVALVESSRGESVMRELAAVAEELVGTVPPGQ